MDPLARWLSRLAGAAALIVSSAALAGPGAFGATPPGAAPAPAPVGRTFGTWVESRLSGSGVAATGGISCTTTEDCWVIGRTAGGAGAGVWATSDGGLSWSEQPLPAADVADLDAISCVRGTGDCWAAGGNGTGSAGVVVATDDGGRSWSAQTVPSGVGILRSISCAASADCVAVGSGPGGVGAAAVWTSDGGATWTFEVPPTATALSGVSCADASHCTAAGEVGVTSGVVLGTDDGGASWHAELLVHGDGGDATAAVACPTAAVCVVVGEKTNASGTATGGLVETTTDAGARWTATAVSRPTSGLTDVSCSSVRDCWATGVQLDHSVSWFVSTSDGGTKWTPSNASVATELRDVAVTCPATSVCYASTAGPDVLATRDALGVGCDGLGAPVWPASAMAVEPGGGGYWLAEPSGEVVACGTATWYGPPVGAPAPPSAVVAMAAAPGGCGYYLLEYDGTVEAFGPCALHLRPVTSSAPFVAMAVDPVTGGYWLVSADGGVFALDAPYRGSLPGVGVVTDDVTGIATTPTGAGYWVVDRSGGVYSFGLPFRGSLPGIGVRVADIVAIASATGASGYLLAAADGGVFAFGPGVRFCGSRAGTLPAPVTGAATYPFSDGYWLLDSYGYVVPIDAPLDGDASFGLNPLPTPCA